MSDPKPGKFLRRAWAIVGPDNGVRIVTLRKATAYNIVVPTKNETIRPVLIYEEWCNRARAALAKVDTRENDE